jgi:hypothetical protein
MRYRNFACIVEQQRAYGALPNPPVQNERCRAQPNAKNRSITSDRGGMSNSGPLLRRGIQKGTREPWNLLRLAEARGALVEHSGSALALAIRPCGD